MYFNSLARHVIDTFEIVRLNVHATPDQVLDKQALLGDCTVFVVFWEMDVPDSTQIKLDLAFSAV